MRVFISYAHSPPENAAFTDRVRARLEREGIETWIDTAKIKSGDPWREAIVKGIASCQQTVAFLSNQAVRPHGVCLDELAMALHEHGEIVPVLIEPETDVKAPHHVSGTQWIDMSTWAAHASDDTWFEAKFAELLDRLTGPHAATRAAEIAVLSRALNPVVQTAAIGAKLDGFTGRDWLPAALSEKRKNGRLIWIMGGPGTGKSAIAAWLATWHRSHTIALNLCEMGIQNRNEPRQIIRTIAFQLARRIDNYRFWLLQTLARLHPAPEQDPGSILTNLAAVWQALGDLQPAALFDLLLLEPLHLTIDGGARHDPYLLVLDGLDETIADEKCELASLLSDRAPRLPAWLSIAAASRNSAAISGPFAGIDPLVLEGADQISDLRAYALDWLGAVGREALVDRVVAAAEGAFLYLSLLRDAVERGWMNLTAPEGLPRGLTRLYLKWFEHLFPDLADYKQHDRPLISVLIASRQPVPIALLETMFDWDEPTSEARLRHLDRLFLTRNSAIGPFHTSLRDWLVRRGDYGAGLYLAAATQGIADLAAALWPRFAAFAADPPGSPMDAFTRTELPGLATRQPEAAFQAALHAAGPWDDVAVALPELVHAAIERFAWVEARALLARILRATAMHGVEGLDLRCWAAVELGDLEMTAGRLDAALTAFEDSLAATSARAAADAGNLGWQRDLSVSHNRIGGVKVAQGDLPGALAAFQAGMEIARRLAAADAGNAAWRRDVAVSHLKLASVARGMGDADGEVGSLRAALAVLDGMAAVGMHLDPQTEGVREQLRARFPV